MAVFQGQSFAQKIERLFNYPTSIQENIPHNAIPCLPGDPSRPAPRETQSISSINEQFTANGRLFWQFQRAGDSETGCRFGFGLLRLGTAQAQRVAAVCARRAPAQFGLQAGIYTNDLHKAMRAVNRLNVGGVIINDVPSFRVDQMPYGGNKESGIGREGPRFAVEEMTTVKMVVLNDLAGKGWR